jgi:hypothetical protein
MPHDPQWDTECLRLAGFDEALNRLQLKFSQPPDKPMSAALTASGTSLRATLEISAGARQVDLYPAYLRLVSNRAQEVLGLVQQRRQAMLELWVRNDPHPRLAGMHRDSTATQEQIDTLEQKIRSLCRPVELALRLTPL